MKNIEDKFLNTYDLPKLNQEDIDKNISRLLTSQEFEAVWEVDEVV